MSSQSSTLSDPRKLIPIKREHSPDIPDMVQGPDMDDDPLMGQDDSFDHEPVRISLVPAELSKTQRKKQRKLARQMRLDLPQPTLSP